MRFGSNDSADNSQIEDRRGLGGPLLLGGGGTGVLGLLAYLVIKLMAGPNHQPPAQTAPRTGAPSAQLGGSCEGVTSSSAPDKFISCVVTQVQTFWADELPRLGQDYQPAHLVLFSDATRSGCGIASSETGPFYCALDGKVYLDLGFFQELTQRFGARGGDFAQAYVVAHEYGHHVQDLLGIREQVDRAMQRNPADRNDLSVKLELQADCFAGVWGHHAYAKGTVEQREITEALDAAAAVGDDRIQRAATGRVNPESFTHGSAAQRQHWFGVGMQTGDPNACDTFSE